MKNRNSRFLVALALGLWLTPATWAAVAVGSSSLIEQLQYSDTYTLTAHGGAAGRVNAAYPVGAPGTTVENNYGNPAQIWTDGKWGLRDAAVAGFPGHTGAGSATGYTGTGGAQAWGIEYGLSRDFIAQVDAVQTDERIYLTIGNARDTTGNANDLTVYFNTTGAIELYNAGVAHITALAGSAIAPGAWHNYAVRFNLNANLLDVYLDETLRGTINLNTFFGGAFTNIITAATDDAVSFGFTGDATGGAYGGTPVTFTDNFQVGILVPEPTTVALLAVGGLLLWRRRVG